MEKDEKILFIASGVSLQSGLPSVKDISKEIYSGKYNYYKNKISKYNNKNGKYIEDETIKRIRSLLRLIESIDQELIKESAPFKMGGMFKQGGALYKFYTSYEDLYFILSEIQKTSKGLSTNSMSNAMVNYIESKAGVELVGNSKHERIIDLNRLCTKCVNFLNWLIPNILWLCSKLDI